MVSGIFDHGLLFQYKRLFISEKGYMNFISYRSKWVCFRTCKPAKNISDQQLQQYQQQEQSMASHLKSLHKKDNEI